ncbi:unnamed protein product [Discosporangium mesarthrocarpum]
MDAVQGMSPSEQQEFMQHLEKMQRKDSLVMFNNLVSRCFDECTKTFRSKKLDDKETKCVDVCADKFLKLTNRVGLRFQDIQQQQAAAAAQVGGAAPGR